MTEENRMANGAGRTRRQILKAGAAGVTFNRLRRGTG